MARLKQGNPTQRIPSGEVMESPADMPETRNVYANGHVKILARKASGGSIVLATTSQSLSSNAGYIQLAICVGGIYASFLSWALLQERITTTPYKIPPTPRGQDAEYFRFPVVLNTIQSLFASLTGSIYLFWASKSSSKPMPIFPTKAILPPLLFISITSSLASPFGYASLSHVDYLTFVLAKSCKLLPVIVLHLILFQKSYPLSKYLIVFAVTAGVAIFTVYHPPSASHSAKSYSAPISSTFGLILLSINLLFDGLTNTIQDHIFSSPARYGRFSGPQMMVAQNILATILTTFYLLFLPYAPSAWIPEMAFPGTLELMRTIWFLSRHPEVLYDVLGFAACGAIGQLFIFATLERFSSLLLVTVTVTRKVLTMLLSVVWFGKRLTPGQWLGVALVFGGVGAEGWEKKREKRRKEAEKKKQ